MRQKKSKSPVCELRHTRALNRWESHPGTGLSHQPKGIGDGKREGKRELQAKRLKGSVMHDEV